MGFLCYHKRVHFLISYRWPSAGDSALSQAICTFNYQPFIQIYIPPMFKSAEETPGTACMQAKNLGITTESPGHCIQSITYPTWDCVHNTYIICLSLATDSTACPNYSSWNHRKSSSMVSPGLSTIDSLHRYREELMKAQTSSYSSWLKTLQEHCAPSCDAWPCGFLELRFLHSITSHHVSATLTLTVSFSHTIL